MTTNLPIVAGCFALVICIACFICNNRDSLKTANFRSEMFLIVIVSYLGGVGIWTGMSMCQACLSLPDPHEDLDDEAKTALISQLKSQKAHFFLAGLAVIVASFFACIQFAVHRVHPTPPPPPPPSVDSKLESS